MKILVDVNIKPIKYKRHFILYYGIKILLEAAMGQQKRK